MGVVSRWVKLRKSYRDGTLTRNLSSLRRGSKSVDSVGEILSEVSKKEGKEISDIVTSINDYLQIPPTEESTSKSWKICRVPNNLREIHQHDFDPKLVSIGPIHHHRSNLKAMAEHKKRFLLRLLDSMDQTLEPELSTEGNGHQNGIIFEAEAAPTHDLHQNGTTLEPVLSQEQCVLINRNAKIENLVVVAMKELEANAKGYYLGTFDKFGQNEFVKMMILDGCFVVELLRLYAKCETGKETDDPIFNTRWMLPNLQRDLLLFENQLPYPVLDKLFEITRSKADIYSLTELTLKFFDPLLPRDPKLLKKCRVDANPDHLLGLFRSTFISSLIVNRRSPSIRHSDSNPMNTSITIPPALEADRQLIPHCVTELKEAGVLFRKRESYYNLLDIEFKDGKLYIPPLSIDDHTCPVLLNFIAYEQCNINAEPYFTHYFLFFDSLVNSSKDVEHLHYKGIIHHMLGSDEDVADLFNKICKEVVHNVDDFYLTETMKEVNQYFHIKRHKWWATWKHNYFSNPWAFSSFLAAVLLLLLTTIQTLFTVFSYVLPPSKS